MSPHFVRDVAATLRTFVEDTFKPLTLPTAL